VGVILKAGQNHRGSFATVDETNLILFILTVGYQLEVQMLMLLVPALCVNVHLMITLLAAGVLIAECLFWFAVVARYDLIICIIYAYIFFVCSFVNLTILKELGRRKSKRKEKKRK